MPNRFYIADMHYGHKNVLEFDNRPFKTIEEMNSALIDRWNAAAVVFMSIQATTIIKNALP